MKIKIRMKIRMKMNIKMKMKIRMKIRKSFLLPPLHQTILADLARRLILRSFQVPRQIILILLSWTKVKSLLRLHLQHKKKKSLRTRFQS